MRSYEKSGLIKSAEYKSGSDGPQDYYGLPRFYLASNVYVGEFGQVGLVIVDRKSNYPSDRGVDTVGFHSPVVPAFFRDALLTSGNDLKKAEKMILEEFRGNGRVRFFDQINTMAALRFYALPKELADTFMQDKYLGPALIRKVCEENLPVKPLDNNPNIPELFVRKSTPENLEWLLRHTYEVPIFTEIDGESVSRLYEYSRIEDEVRKITAYSLGKFLDTLIKPLTGRSADDYFPVGYVTYFGTSLIVYKSVTALLEPLAAEVVQRFDELWRRLEFGRLPILPSGPRKLPPG